MYVLNTKWINKYLDYHRLQNQYRIDTKVWMTVMPVPSQYFVRPRTWRIIWNYLREVGLFAVIYRIKSRLAESGRNEKYLSIGIGTIREQMENGKFKIGDQVVFVAYNHPKCVSSLCMEEELLFKWDHELPKQGEEIRWFSAPKNWTPPQSLTEMAGWSFYSGQPPSDISSIRSDIITALNQTIHTNTETKLPVSSAALPIQEETKDRALPTQNSDLTKRAVLFGLGNYAKVVILPYLNKRIDIERIHELDPTQIGPITSNKYIYDTSDVPRNNEKYDAYFIAGYHHTHAQLAIDALAQGAYVAIEKPIATTMQQINAFESIVSRQTNSRFFACFNRRYGLYNNWINADFDKNNNNPISMHCLVYEEPLPEKHWYLWPNSGSYIISCACHWIDHFLFVNNYLFAYKYWVQRTRNGDINVTLELENGAVFTMVITETGSPRLGVRDYVEVKQGNIVARLINGSSYEAENHHRILNRQSVNRLNSHIQMYRNVSDRIIAGQSGDSIESIYSSRLVIELEQLLMEENTPNKNIVNFDKIKKSLCTT